MKVDEQLVLNNHHTTVVFDYESRINSPDVTVASVSHEHG